VKKKGKQGINKLLMGGGVLAAVASLTVVNIYGRRIDWPAYEVREVVDGDTFFTKEGLIIRLASLDAPEIGVCGGEEAAEALRKLIMGKPLYIKAIQRDMYDRLIAHVYTKDVYVNKNLLEMGAAYYDMSDEWSKNLREIGGRARNEKRGVFGEKCTQTINREDPECVIKGNTSLNGGKIPMYRFPECAQYETTLVQLYLGDRWFCSEEEARKAGFVKGSDCTEKKWR